MSKQIVALVTKHERMTIKVDGVVYELLDPEDLKLKDALWLEKIAPRIDSLLKQINESVEPDDATIELANLVLHVTDIIMGDVPKEVCNKLSDVQRLSIIQAYITSSTGDKVKRPLPEREVGEPSSQDSSASMEETPPHGES